MARSTTELKGSGNNVFCDLCPTWIGNVSHVRLTFFTPFIQTRFNKPNYTIHPASLKSANSWCKAPPCVHGVKYLTNFTPYKIRCGRILRESKTVRKSLSMRNVWRHVNPPPPKRERERERIQRPLIVRVLHLLCLQCFNMTILSIFSNSLPNNFWKCHEIKFCLFIYIMLQSTLKSKKGIWCWGEYLDLGRTR